MTPREQLNDLAGHHVDELRRRHCWPVAVAVGALLLHVVFWRDWLPEWLELGVLGVLFAMVLVHFWHQRRNTSWLKAFRCPGCERDLSYWLTDPDYYREPPAGGVPDRIDSCPFCDLPFDGEET